MEAVHTTLVENVRIDCYVMDKEKLCLILMDNITNVLLHTEVIHKFTPGLDAYVIVDLGSGTSSTGLSCLSITICEDTDVDIPNVKDLAYYIRPNNTVELYSENDWSDRLNHPYYEYNENEQDFVMFKP